MRRVLTLFGTRPEVIKLAPVLAELGRRSGRFAPMTVSSGQHGDLLAPFLRLFRVQLDANLGVMRAGQTPLQVCHRVLASLEPLLNDVQPDVLLVQGDTTTAMAGALAAFHHGVPVGHVEAGLRSGNRTNPFPEEMNRRLISRLASFHFAATPRNVETLLAEGVPADRIALTGNPVIDALRGVLGTTRPSPLLEKLLFETHGRRLLVLTTHRRESFGEVMLENLRVLRRFVERHVDVALAFPVHPNPAVRAATQEAFSGTPHVHLLEPLDYPDFVQLLSHAWLIVSDSGGVQEEAPTLGKPLLILRENTERPEAVESGVARLVGTSASRLEAMLEDTYSDGTWIRHIRETENPFGRGDSAVRIVDALEKFLDA
ncbi:MAG TPA: UDP-N-acetylglucosamine 2-epimerase (non-hydrolyzing) [Myxococcota bacterium]|nr:UDP-N-acetylglucosamine 2-epimerase (non-hydrolyzing) [Myxococcota bacterium]